MKRLLLSGLVSVILFPRLGAATDAVYTINGTVTFPPQIDAITVINNGTMDIFTELPFETSNTQNFTNNGSIFGSVGFRFDNADPITSARKPFANFFNRLDATLEAGDRTIFVGAFTAIDQSYLLVDSTNITSQGLLTAGASGTLRLTGSNINLARSGVQIRPITPVGSFNGILTNFFLPDIAIYDNYWGQTNQVMDSSEIIQPFGQDLFVLSPPHFVEGPGGAAGTVQILLFNPVGEFYTNNLGTTNITVTNMSGATMEVEVPLTNIVQAAFVGLAETNDFNVGIRFFDSFDLQNPMKTVSVGLTTTSTNVVTVNPELASLYLVDTLASETNRAFYTNLFAGTSRPQNYLLSRLEPFEFFFGFPGNASFAETLLYDTNFASAIVTNDYAAYSAFVDNIGSRPPIVPGSAVKDLPGRIGIFADTLDLTKTRFRGEGLFTVQAKHLVGSSNAAIDSENLSYTLGSTNGHLNIVNLAKESVARLKGDMFVWSGVWTNQINQILENFMPDPMDTNTYIPAPITNVIEVRLHVLMLDATILLTHLPVTVHDLVTHSTNVVLNDNMTVVQSLLIDGQSLTLNGNLTLSNTFFIDPAGVNVVIALNNWISTNAPNLRFFTNHGSLTIPIQAHFGDDRPIPYAVFVNKGTIDAFSQTIDSDYCELGGTNRTAGVLSVITRSGKVEDGTLRSGGDVQFFADVLKLNRSTIITDRRFDLIVTDSLSDAGGASSNTVVCRGGFRLLVKPAGGDLLGTAIQTVAPQFAAVNHTWAGADRGANKAGFADNAAIGRLKLIAEGLDPLFVFTGTGGANGLYVDYLDFSQLPNYQDVLQINPNLVIYFADSSVPAEELDGQLDGRLRWVRDFAGPNSSVDVVLNGTQTIQVNKALRNSINIDSDGDGTPNFFDLTPFDAPSAPLVVQVNGSGAVSPDLNGQLLELGKSYTVTAVPGSGHAFSNWTGGVTSTSRQLTFTMESNLVLVATFVPRSFMPTVGSYSGLFFESTGVRRSSSGAFTATTTSGGNYSGLLQIGGNRYSFSGQFNAAGAGTNVIARTGANSLTLILQMDVAANERITGTVSDGSWVAGLEANRAVFNASSNPALLAGKYTIVFQGNDDPGDVQKPHGDGFGAVTVDLSGRIRLKGRLADGEKLTQTASLSQDGRWPLYVSLYRGQGQVLGWLSFTNAVEEDLGGPVSWIKSPIPTARYYSAGFDLNVPVTGSAYNAAASPPLNFSNGTIAFTGGNLAASIMNSVMFGQDNKVIDLSGTKLTLKLNASQGLFKGSVVDPSTSQSVSFNGAILQKQNSGRGFFLGTNQSGRVDFGP